jgi:hypothetical protein
MIAPPIVCAVCGSSHWLACAPGTEAEPVRQGSLFVLAPAPEVPLRAWCVSHLPWRVRSAA